MHTPSDLRRNPGGFRWALLAQLRGLGLLCRLQLQCPALVRVTLVGTNGLQSA